MTSSRSRSPVRRASPYLWALGACWVLPVVVVGVGYLLLPKTNPDGQCEGIGFGCTPAPADGLLLVGLLASPYLLGLGALLCVVIAVVRGVRSRREDPQR